MRCRACGRDNDASKLFCSDCAAELVPGAARETEPPRARDRRGRWLAVQERRLRGRWEDFGYSVQRAKPDWQGSISAAKRVALALASVAPGLGHIALGQQRRGLIMLGIFLLGVVGWLAFIGTTFAAIMVFILASTALTSVVDCLRITYHGPQAQPRLSHVLWAVAIVCGTYALGVWLLSLRWERAVTNLNIVRLAPPESRSGPAPVFAVGDRLLVTRAVYRKNGVLVRGDIVLAQVNGQTVIQRILAVPGDRLEFSRGSLWLNGKALDESQYPLQPLNAIEVHGNGQVVALPWSGVVSEGQYAIWDMQPAAEVPYANVGPTILNQRSILGKVWLIYSPYNHRRIVNHANPVL